MSANTRIKICGLTREVDVEAAVQAGAAAIGLVMYARSPRFVSVQRATQLARQLPPFVSPVLLFVNAESDFIDEATQAVPNALLQFHGDENPAECDRYGRPYLRAARMAEGLDLLNFAAHYPHAQGLLLDAHVDAYGGSGKVFDWSLIPHNVCHPVVLSGGLHAGNVIDGILQVRPWAVDVSSGVESAKGIKDAQAIRQFCDAVREADARIANTPT